MNESRHFALRYLGIAPATARTAIGARVPSLVPCHHNHPAGDFIGIRLETDHVVALRQRKAPPYGWGCANSEDGFYFPGNMRRNTLSRSNSRCFSAAAT